MTHLEMTHEQHHPPARPTHTLLDAIANARQLAAQRHEDFIVYWDEDFNTYSWIPEHDWHHDPQYQHIEEKDVHWHSEEGYYIRAPEEIQAAATTDSIITQWHAIIANDQKKGDPA